MLPLGSFQPPLAIEGSIKNLRLKPPVCYQRQEDGTSTWAKGYEDEGANIQKRKFPVMWFGDNQEIPTDDKLFVIPPHTLSWLPAADLRRFDTHGPDGKPVSSHKSAAKFAEWLKAKRKAGPLSHAGMEAACSAPDDFQLVSVSSKGLRFACGGEHPPLQLRVGADGIARTGQDADMNLEIDPRSITNISSHTDDATTRLRL